MTVDFEDEVKSDFQSTMIWTRVVLVLYGVFFIVGPFVQYIDPTPSIPAAFARFILLFGMALILAGIFLPKSPVAIGSVTIACLAAFQTYLYLVSGKMVLFLMIAIVVGIWDIYAYISYNKFAKQHLNSSPDED